MRRERRGRAWLSMIPVGGCVAIDLGGDHLCGRVGADVTGPLAQQFARVESVLERAGISKDAIGWESPGGYCPSCEMADGCHGHECEIADALAALSAIERHVQDMEIMLRAAYIYYPKGTPMSESMGDLLAALPAREKGEK